MSVLSLVFDAASDFLGDALGLGGDKPKGVKRVAIGVILLDAAISEVHNYKTDVTTLPVEKGADMTDHAILQPMQLTIEGFITNSPLKASTSSDGDGAFGVLGGIADSILGGSSISTVVGGALGNAIGGALGSTIGGVVGGLLGNAIDPPKDYVNIAFTQMLKLREKRVPVTIVSTLEVHLNMMMTSLTIPRDQNIGDSLRFTAEFVQIKTAKAEEITIPSETVADQATETKDAGRQTTTTVVDEVKEKASVLYKLVK